MQYKILTYEGKPTIEGTLTPVGDNRVPLLYNMNTTIDGIIESHSKVPLMAPLINSGFYNNYHENLKKCELKVVNVEFVDSDDTTNQHISDIEEVV